MTRNRAAASWVMFADTAEARLTPTKTLTMAPQKAPSPPMSAAIVATAAPRFLTSAAMAGYETARAPEREQCERARDVELDRVFGCDGPHLQCGRRGLYDLVGAFGVEPLRTYVQHGGDGEEKR